MPRCHLWKETPRRSLSRDDRGLCCFTYTVKSNGQSPMPWIQYLNGDFSQSSRFFLWRPIRKSALGPQHKNHQYKPLTPYIVSAQLRIVYSYNSECLIVPRRKVKVAAVFFLPPAAHLYHTAVPGTIAWTTTETVIQLGISVQVRQMWRGGRRSCWEYTAITLNGKISGSMLTAWVHLLASS